MKIIAGVREFIGSVIPQIIALLKNSDKGICKAGAETLLQLSGQGKIPSFLIWPH